MKGFKLTRLEKFLMLLSLITIIITLVFGFTYGVAMVFLLTAGLFVWMILRKNKSKSKLIYVGYKAVSIGFILWALSFSLIMGVVLTSITYEIKNKDYDYIMVLGAGVRGETLSLILEKRMEKALELSEIMPEAKIILSGGQGEGENITEAEAMKRYLLEHNVDLERIILEDQSTSTSENFEYSKKKLEPYLTEDETILVLTSDFHLFRSLRLAESKDLSVDGVAAKTPLFIKLNYLAREYLAVIKSGLFD